MREGKRKISNEYKKKSWWFIMTKKGGRNGEEKITKSVYWERR